MFQVPLHALVVMVGPSGAGKSTFIETCFKPYEVVSSDAIRQELTGDFRNQHANEIMWQEFYRRIETKLRLGERVVADATHLKKQDRVRTAVIGANLRVPVFYIVVDRPIEEKLETAGWRASVPGLIEKHAATFKGQEKDILSGDNMATVIDTRVVGEVTVAGDEVHDVEIVEKINFDNLADHLLEKGFETYAVIGDVHGMTADFQNAIEKAEASNAFIIQLGDIVDYGPDAFGCVDIMYRLVMAGDAAFIIGNHERKLERYLRQRKEGKIRIKTTGGIVATIEQIDRMGESKVELFENKFAALMNHARHHIRLGNTLFVHASSTKTMWKNVQNRLVGFDEQRAVFGQIDEEVKWREDGFPNRIYDWVDEIPAGHKVFVGHDVRRTSAPLIVLGKNGGEATFVDTGSGKEGRLSTVIEPIVI